MSRHSSPARPARSLAAVRPRPFALTVTLAASLAAAGCGHESVSAPKATFAPLGRSDLVSVGSPQTIQVCKTGPAGSYTFTLSQPAGNTHPSDVILASPFALVIPAGSTGPVCTTIYTRTQSDGPTSDAPANITVTEAPATGTTLLSITTVSGGGPLQQPIVDVQNRRATLFINAYHGEKATFNNVAVPTTKKKKCDADFSKKDPKVHDEDHDCRSEQGEIHDKKYRDS